VVSFGLANAQDSFMNLKNMSFSYMEKFVLIFIYDILVYFESISDHVEHLRIVLQAFRETSGCMPNSASLNFV
jgi:hypothetical protein